MEHQTMRLEISEQERAELVRLVESALSDTRVETRRTSKPDWRDKLRNEEQLLATLLGRLKTTEI